MPTTRAIDRQPDQISVPPHCMPAVRVLVVLQERVTETVAEAIAAVSSDVRLESGYDRMLLVSTPLDQLVALSFLPEIEQIIEASAMSNTP